MKSTVHTNDGQSPSPSLGFSQYTLHSRAMALVVLKFMWPEPEIDGSRAFPPSRRPVRTNVQTPRASVSVEPSSVANLCRVELLQGLMVVAGLDAQDDEAVGAAAGLLVQ